MSRMFVLWRERKHEEVDRAVFDNDEEKQALRACGMYKFFQIGGMRVQRRLLNLLIDYWNPDVEAFMLVGQSLTITLKTSTSLPVFLGEGKCQTSNLVEEARVSMTLSMSIVMPTPRKVALKCRSNRSPT
jgi:hypothetical protein